MGARYIYKQCDIAAPRVGERVLIDAVVERVTWNEAESGYEVYVRTPYERQKDGRMAAPRSRTITGTGPRPTSGKMVPDSMHNVGDWSREDQAKWAQARKEETIGTQEA